MKTASENFKNKVSQPTCVVVCDFSVLQSSVTFLYLSMTIRVLAVTISPTRNKEICY